MSQPSVGNHKEGYYIMSMRRLYLLPCISCRVFSYVCGKLAMPMIIFNKRFEYAIINRAIQVLRYIRQACIKYTYSFAYIYITYTFFFNLVMFSCNYM